MAEQMKPSGVSWIGDIPFDWNIGKVRFETKIRAEKGFEQTVFLAHVCGTRMDPQQYYRQTAMLKNTNISFFSSNAGMVKYGISLRNQSV